MYQKTDAQTECGFTLLNKKGIYLDRKFVTASNVYTDNIIHYGHKHVFIYKKIWASSDIISSLTNNIVKLGHLEYTVNSHLKKEMLH